MKHSDNEGFNWESRWTKWITQRFINQTVKMWPLLKLENHDIGAHRVVCWTTDIILFRAI